ncbi:retropepsin-like aspartic protease [Alicyclobacillus fastidiosus]|uniref:Retropepsin-like aspartic protease n=1 Tax=Alicyclobacillus fastidiosus TaxID=392011 RepID=A0ABV5AGM8_9BACL|nr:retropepsin-like aspartic protease [Alicyclobacillus fastidiosus]WEH12165.1 retropepsin-like aspartic protease [Alicyclobacillus fastidiosus]
MTKFSMMLTSSALALMVPCVATTAYAATSSVAKGQVRAEVNGVSIPAIAVGDETYLEWQALKSFHSPYEYLGGGKFAITGGTVQGVVYKGNTYLPWTQVASKVKATKLKGGGFNFTAVPVQHDYEIYIDKQSADVGSPAAIDVLVGDNDASVPHQSIHLQVTGSAHFASDENRNTLSDYTDQDGSWIGAVDDTKAETVQVTASWTDPSGHVQTQTQLITFSPASTQATVTPPSGDTVVATVPITTYQNAVLFNAQAGGSDVLLQLDTGAFEPLITKSLADALNLPNLGAIQVEGVGGEDSAYVSQITLSIGGTQFTDVPCIVDPSYSGVPLFGYGFFKDNGYDLLVSQKDSTMTILK